MPSAKTKKPFKLLIAWRAAPSLLDPLICIARSLSFAEWNHCQIPFFAPFYLGVKMNIFQGSQSPAIWQGRSSGSPALLATFPSRLVETVVFAAKRVLSSYTTNNKKSRVTAAGPLPTLTGFPIKLTHLIPWEYPLRENRSQVNKIQLTTALGSFNWVLKI